MTDQLPARLRDAAEWVTGSTYMVVARRTSPEGGLLHYSTAQALAPCPGRGVRNRTVFRGTTAVNARRCIRGGTRQVDDALTHEMLHVWLLITGHQVSHDSADWYDAVRRLSPAVLGHELNARRGGGRKSVRIVNPAYRLGAGIPKTLVRKQTVVAAVSHADVARWPQSFRPATYDWGQPIACPSC